MTSETPETHDAALARAATDATNATAEAPPSHRETCFVCFKPQVTCVCADITPVHNRVGVSVLQHPRERAHPLGTARFVELGLVNSEVIVAFTGARERDVPLPLPSGTGLLYPRPDALDLEHVPVSAQPRHLLVLDGTWSQARGLYKAHPWLAQLPHYQLSPDTPSRYRIRREPRPEYVSTLESVLLALRILEPDTQGFEGLLSAFDALVDTQIAHHQRARAAGRPKRQKRVRKERRYKGVPRWLAEDAERLVGLYAEALPPASAGPAKSGPLLQLVAMRLATGETFERLVRPVEGLPDAEALATLGLRPEDFESAIAPAELAAALDAYLRPGDVGLAWNRSTPSLMHDATGRPHRMRLLKPVLRELGPFDEHGSLQSLDVLAEAARTAATDASAVSAPGDAAGRGRSAADAEGHAPLAAHADAPLTRVRGRAAARLANLAWVAHTTREHGRQRAVSDEGRSVGSDIGPGG
ncbi:MAG: DTW domain-containing protein [Sandaracinaceae bacterium]|nr:DTW domain-containing protein [Sandaracinaceae bacterium]